jgi:hypothetical protein
MRYDASWVSPAKPGLAQTPCRAGEDCSLPSPHLVVACTTRDGYCAGCAEKRGIPLGVDEPAPCEQLRLGAGSLGA